MAREINLNGRLFKVRPLTRKSIKALKKYGFGSMRCDLEQKTADEAMDAAFAKVFDGEDLKAIEDLGNPDVLKLWVTLLKETYGAEDEEKNLQGSGPGTQTKSE